MNPMVNFKSNTSLLLELQEANLASEFKKILEAHIKRFDESLDSDHEVGIKLVSFGQNITFHVSKLSYHNPSLIFFIGFTEEGRSVELVQHVSQISFLLCAIPKFHPNQPKRQFGFTSSTEENSMCESKI